MQDYIVISIVLVVAAVVFTILFRKGYFLRVSGYVRETRDELKKCTWPTRDELKASTALVAVSIILLGAFTVVVDLAIGMVIKMIT